MSQKETAERLGVSESTVSRRLANHRDAVAGSGPAQAAVDVFVLSLGAELAPDTAARVEALRSLAAKLDWARAASTGTAAMAAAQISKEYRALVDELQQVRGFDELRTALLAVGDED